MPLTTEQLLIPRWKIISPIPFLPSEWKYLYKVDFIITDDGKSSAFNQNGVHVFATEWEEYPNIFQSLPWWSDRNPEDMPEYVASKPIFESDNVKCYKVSEWYIYKQPVGGEEMIGFTSPYGHTIGAHAVLPIDEQEYTAYISQKQ